MSFRIHLDRNSSTPLYRQIAETIRARVADGALPRGTRLPTVRQLAKDLGTTTLTVQTAYSDLQSEGWITAVVGRGTFVEALPRPAAVIGSMGQNLTPDGVLSDETKIQQVMGLRSLASSDPDPASYPVEAFSEVLGEASRDPALLAYGPAEGDARLRVALAEHLRGRGVGVAPDTILVTRGVTHALSLLTRALAQPGDTVLVSSPTYLGFLNTLQARGVTPLGVPLDDEGPDLGVLEHLLDKHRPRFFYTVPTYHNPTGRSVGSARREALLSLADRRGFVVLEDDIYGHLPIDGDAPPPLYGKGASTIVYTGGFSKALMPALRTGYVLAPPALLERLRFLRQAEDLCGSTFTERALALFLERGYFDTHLDRTLPKLKVKRDALLDALERFMPRGVTWTVPQGGFNLWVSLPKGGFADLYSATLQRRVAFAPGHAFLAPPSERYHFRLCFGMLPPEQLVAGVQTIAELVEARLGGASAPTVQVKVTPSL